MKKNILFLINGFGIEQVGSYNVYSGDLMPHIERLTKENLFCTIECNNLDYISGYRNFSMGINEPLTYSLVNTSIINKEYKNNQVFKYIISQVAQLKSRLHIFCYWDNEKLLDQLYFYINELLLYKDIRICIHILYCQKSIEEYKYMSSQLSKYNYEFGPNVTLGLATGVDYIKDLTHMKDYVKAFITGAGEKWKDINKKFEILKDTSTAPNMARTYEISENFRLEENDQVLFYNYSKVDVSEFISTINKQKNREMNLETIKYYSLFPIENNIPYMYNYATSSTCTLSHLKEIGAKAIVLDKTANCGNINYYLTGLSNVNDETIKYISTDNDFIYDPNSLINYISTLNEELIIINYELETCKDVNELEVRLSKIDTVIGILDNYVKTNHMALIISSLYGMQKNMYNQKNERCSINFSKRIPLIIDDSDYSKTKYTLNEGKVYDISNTIYKNINIGAKTSSLIKKKSSLFSFLYKKPKEEK